jgi:hypothetical protein
VVLPSSAQAGHELLLIDRSNAALTWVDAKTCTPVRQLSAGTGFAANPRDVVSIRESKAYVTRYDQNGAPTASPDDFDEGSDLLIIDPSAPRILGRIDLSGEAPAANVLPRPDQALLAGGKVYVTLNALSADFQAAASGRVVIIDPETDSIVGRIDLTGRKGCSGMTYLEGTKTLLVACGGNFSDGDGQAASSGIVAIDLGLSPPAVKGTVSAAVLGGRLSTGGVAALSENEIFTITSGEFSGAPPDQLWTFGLASTGATKLLDGSGAFVLGGFLMDRSHQRLFVADGTTSAPRIRVFDASNPAEVKEASSFNPSPTQGLPPRGIAFY